MKPHLRLIRGLWHCGRRGKAGGYMGRAIGVGYTPEDAFRDWELVDLW